MKFWRCSICVCKLLGRTVLAPYSLFFLKSLAILILTLVFKDSSSFGLNFLFFVIGMLKRIFEFLDCIKLFWGVKSGFGELSGLMSHISGDFLFTLKLANFRSESATLYLWFTLSISCILDAFLTLSETILKISDKRDSAVF